MSFYQSPRLPRHRPLSANEITAIALAVTAGRDPRNALGEVSGLHRVGSTLATQAGEGVDSDPLLRAARDGQPLNSLSSQRRPIG